MTFFSFGVLFVNLTFVFKEVRLEHILNHLFLLGKDLISWQVAKLIHECIEVNVRKGLIFIIRLFCNFDLAQCYLFHECSDSNIVKRHFTKELFKLISLLFFVKFSILDVS